MSADALLRQQPRNHHESETYVQGFLTHPLSVVYSDSDTIEKASVGRRLKDGTFVPFGRDDDVVTDRRLVGGALVHGGELMSFKLKRDVPDLDVEYSAPQQTET